VWALVVHYTSPIEMTDPDAPMRQTILLVEDQALIALAEKNTLESHGYSVITANTGERAVEVVASGRPIDLILMDVNLGAGIDGPTAAERILAGRNVPIAFLSAHTEPEVVERTEQITSYGYIVKDSGDTVLLASVRMAFRLFDAMHSVEASRRMLATILEVSSHLIETRDLQVILQTASDQLASIAGMDGGAVYLVDHESVVMKAATPAVSADFPDHLTRAPLSEHPHIRMAIETRSPVSVFDTAAEDFTPAEQEVVRLRSLRSILYVPLIVRATAIGVFISGSTEAPTIFSGEVVHLCSTLANIVALAAEGAMMDATR